MNHCPKLELMTVRHPSLNKAAPDDSAVTEIEIAPDGRLFLFGASREVLQLLLDVGLARQKAQSHVVDRLPGLAPSRRDDQR